MINPFLTGIALLSWFLSFTYSPQFFVFALGFSIYAIVLTLFVSPTIPRGKLPQLDDVYIRAFFDCLKSRQLKNSQVDIVPSISSAASHLLFSLDTVWQLDTSIGPLLDKSKTDNQIAQYCSQNPIERSQRVYTVVDSSKKVAQSAKEIITAHVQRIRTIPLAIIPSNYLIPTFSLEASIQTFLHFPLQAWKSQLKMSDITVYFPAPRGAQFFYDSSIVAVRQIRSAAGRTSDLAIDIQTTISIDRNRLVKLYSEEEEYDRKEREYIEKLQQQDIEVQARAMEKLDAEHEKEKTERQLNALRQPEELVLVARIVTTYVYPGVVAPTWFDSNQVHFPQHEEGFENLLGKLCSRQKSEVEPKATINVTSLASTSYASTCGNIHPKMMSGPLATLFGYDSSTNSQLDVSFATHFALNIYHALLDDTLDAGLSRSRLAKAIISEEHDDEHHENTEETKFIYPYRALFQTVATLNAPASIRCYVTPTASHSQRIPHRGLLYSQHLQERLHLEQLKKEGKEEEKIVVLPDEISTEAFPQFTQQRTITLTVADGGDEIVWAQGVVLTESV